MRNFIMLALLAATTSLVSCDKDDDNVTKPDTVVVDYHTTATTQFVEAGGTKYAYRVLGKQEGTPLVMLAPLGASMDDWDPAVTNGLAAKYKVIIFDNVGIASSTGTTPSTIADMAKGATTFIKALGYNKVNLLGFSMGSFVGQQILLTEPSIVNKIVLTGTGPKGATGLSNLPNILAGAAGLSPEESFLYFGFTKSAASRDSGLLVYQRVALRKVNRDTTLSEQASNAAFTAVLGWAQPNENALTELEQITQPTLIIQGEEDLPVPVVNAVNMSKHIHNSQLIIFKDAAHASLFQYHTEFVGHVSEFLGQ